MGGGVFLTLHPNIYFADMLCGLESEFFCFPPNIFNFVCMCVCVRVCVCVCVHMYACTGVCTHMLKLLSRFLLFVILCL